MQKITTSLIVVVFVLFANLIYAGGDDFMYFSAFEFKHKINDSLDVFIQPELRFNDDISELYYWHIRNGIIYHLDKNLDLVSTYRLKQTEDSTGSWIPENRLELEINPKISLNGFKLSDRNRFEYRDLRGSKDRWRYRNMLKISRYLEQYKITPYISEEIFYDFEINKLETNWATLGVSKKLTKEITGSIFYRWESKRVGTTSHWDSNHILGTKIGYKF